ncbi:MAG: hypothetical protein ABJD97_03305 [Betaproteobacteria bacterium]
MRHVLALAAAALMSTGALAQSDKEHAAHHPAGTASAAAPASKAPTPARMDMQMKSMQEMHEKMMAARTPEERQALMAEHMKTMQDGMAMMGQMRGGGSAAKTGAGMSPQTMSMRMDMMESMMDHEATSPAGK